MKNAIHLYQLQFSMAASTADDKAAVHVDHGVFYFSNKDNNNWVTAVKLLRFPTWYNFLEKVYARLL